MTRKSNTKQEIRALFSRTGNQCAFPGCTDPLVEDDDLYVGEICHIEAAKEGGPRYNPNMTDEDRKSIRNLIVLCRRHHIKIDNDINLYTVKRLQNMKRDHEKNWSIRPYVVPDKTIDRIFEEQMVFEHEISCINKKWQRDFDLAMSLELSENPSEHLNAILDKISHMRALLDDISGFFDDLPESIENFLDELGYDLTDYRKVPYYRNPLHNNFWEMLKIGAPNLLNAMRFHSRALEFHIEIQKLKAHPNDASVRARLDELKSQIRVLASTSTHVD